MKKQKKKNRRLLFQMGVLCVGIFVLALLTTAMSIAVNQVEMGIDLANRPNRHIARKIARGLEKNKDLSWLMDFWETHPEEYRNAAEKYYSLGEDAQKEFFKYLDESPLPAESWYWEEAQQLTVEMVEAMPQKLQEMTVAYSQEYMEQDMNEAEKVAPNGNLFFARGATDGKAFVFLDAQSDNDRDPNKNMQYIDVPGELGKYYFGLEGGRSPEELKRDYDIIRMDYDPAIPDDVAYITLVYEPVMVDGEQVAVVFMENTWTVADLISIFGRVIDTEKYLLLFVVVFTILLLVLLHRLVVRPITRLQKNVREYAKDRDADKLTTALAGITSRNEIGRLTDDISEMGIEIDRYAAELVRTLEKKAKLQAEKERIGAELSVASRIQMGVLPGEFPAFPDRKEFDIYASMTPAREVGGDLYDYYLVDPDHLVLVIGDVSGKGIPAALFMVTTKALVKSVFMNGKRSPAEALSAVNNRMSEGNSESMFVTMWVGILEISTGRMICTNAGHEFPLIARSGEGFSLYRDKHSKPLGSMTDVDFKEYEISLGKGDILFVYTDGVPEAHNSKNELFGNDAMLATLNREPESDLKNLLERLSKDVAEFVGEREAFDDITMLCIRYNG